MLLGDLVERAEAMARLFRKKVVGDRKKTAGEAKPKRPKPRK